MRLAPTFIILALGVVAAALASGVEATAIRTALTIGAVIATLVGGARASSSGMRAAAPESTPAERQDAVAGLGRDRRNPIIDRTTGLCTDWYFRLRLEEEIQRAARFGQRFAVVLVSKGTAKNNVALTLRRLRHVDYAADLGEVIAVALPNTDAEGARKWQARFDAIIPADIRIAEYPRDGETVARLLGEDNWETSNFETSAA